MWKITIDSEICPFLCEVCLKAADERVCEYPSKPQPPDFSVDCAESTCPLRAADLKPLVRELADALEGLIAYEDEDCDPEFHYLGNDLRALVERAREEAG
jgi:hypothetical protein